MGSRLRQVLPREADPVPPNVEQEFQDFSYIVSHDLATSLRHMSEFTRLLIEDLGGDLTAPQQAYAEHVRHAGAHCQAMTEQLLIFSRVQQKPLERTRQDGDAVLHLALLRLVGSIRAANAEVVTSALGEVWADPALLGLALRHLIDNAIKFSRGREPPRVEIRPAHDGHVWRVRISDNGEGVDPAFREKAFRMFQRLHSNGAVPGVGAGLAISRRIARRHGGEVRFLDCDHGACVELALPRGLA